MPPLLAATDLDGTLLRTDGSVSARTRRALADTERAGATVLFVTARPVRWFEGLRELVGGHGLVVCANGAVVLELASGRVLDAFPITRDAALRGAALLREAVPGIAFARESTSGFGREPAFTPRYEPPPDSPVGPLEDVLDDGTVKLLARHDALTRDELFARVQAALGGTSGGTRGGVLSASVSGPGALVELSASGVSKAGALALVAERLGVPRGDVVAFGDMINDLPMLEWAGRAVAVANAHPLVLAVADEVAPSNDDDGVAVVLERLLEERADLSPG